MGGIRVRGKEGVEFEGKWLRTLEGREKRALEGGRVMFCAERGGRRAEAGKRGCKREREKERACKGYERTGEENRNSKMPLYYERWHPSFPPNCSPLISGLRGTQTWVEY